MDEVEAVGSFHEDHDAMELFIVSLMQLKLRMAQTLDVAEVAGSSVEHFAEWMSSRCP